MVMGVTHQSSTSNKSQPLTLQYSKVYWKKRLARPAGITRGWIACRKVRPVTDDPAP
jgi:hypothetical protein